MSLDYKQVLKDFLESSADVDIVYRNTPKVIDSSTDGVYILDSSFNPPHLGHYALAKEVMNHTINGMNKPFLLLLAVNNAEKLVLQPEPLETRLQMMCFMAQYLHEDMGVKSSVGLTKHARFAEKADSIMQYLSREYQPDHTIKLTFLLGFDTLVRLLDPKFYLPDKLSTSLERFMSTANVFCLARGIDLVSIKEQQEYVKDINEGKYEHIPPHWSERIVVPDIIKPEIGAISSSSIRKSIRSGDKLWEEQVIPAVRDLILLRQLYQNN